MYSTPGPGRSSPHHWLSLDELEASGVSFLGLRHEARPTMRRRDRLRRPGTGEAGVFMVIIWEPIQLSDRTEDVGRVALKLLMRQPSALPRFGGQSGTGIP